MTYNDEVLNDDSKNSTPLAISSITENTLNQEGLLTAAALVRVNSVKLLTELLNGLTADIKSATNARTKLELTKQVTTIQSAIHANLRVLEAKTLNPNYTKTRVHSIKASTNPLDTPYLDFTRRKRRSETWKDYKKFCEKLELEPLNKKAFFAAVTRLGFTIARTHGEVMLKPRGVR